MDLGPLIHDIIIILSKDVTNLFLIDLFVENHKPKKTLNEDTILRNFPAICVFKTNSNLPEQVN